MSMAKKMAHSLPPKLTVPMILFFLPVLFAVIITPAWRFRKFVAPVALRIQKRGQIAMIDTRMRRCCDRGLCVIGDAEPCLLQHGEIVGAVADGECVGAIEAEG